MQYILLFQAFLTLFLSGGLFFKENELKNRSIALYFLIFSLEILYFVYGTSGIVPMYPALIGRFYFSFGLLYGPILWLHFKSAVDQRKQLRYNDLWPLLPLLILNISMWDILLLSNQERMEYFNNRVNFENRIIYLNYFRAIHQIVYGILLVRILRSNLSLLNVNEKFYLGGISLIYIITTIVITLLTLFAGSWLDFYLYYLFCTIFVFITGYILYKDPKFFRAIKEKYQTSFLTKKEMEKIHHKIENEYLHNKIYLDNNLTLELLATQLGVKSYQISQTLSQIVKENFNDYTNRHRINHSKKLMTLDLYENYKIEAIALESGFNNKVTFYKAFSKFVGVTPSHYRKNRENK